MDAIFHRTSIRKYQETPVEAEKIETLLRAAMAAPSACNQQPWEFYVVRNKEKIKDLEKLLNAYYSGAIAEKFTR